MKHFITLSIALTILIAFISCGEAIETQKKVPDNFPLIKKKKSATIYKDFGQGISYKIVTYQQYYESKKTKQKPAEKHLVTLSKPSKGRDLKLDLPLDMEIIRKFRRIETSKFEGAGPIVLEQEHQFKDKNQISYWKYHKDSTSTKVFLQEGSYSFIRQKDFEMLHIYDSANDIEYMEMKME